MLQFFGLLIVLLIALIIAITGGGVRNTALDNASTLLVAFITILTNLAYYTFFWSTEGGGQSIGNKVAGIRIARPNGETVSPPRAFARAVVMYLSIVLFLMPMVASLVTILVTPRRQALHDLICDTVVLRT